MTQFTTLLFNIPASKRDTMSTYSKRNYNILKIKIPIRIVSGGGFGGEPINFD